MPVEVREASLSATSDGSAKGANDRIFDSIGNAIQDFITNQSPSSVDQITTTITGQNRCAVIIVYTA